MSVDALAAGGHHPPLMVGRAERSSSTAVASDEFGTFDFGLDSDQEERARRLFAESIVVDMLFQGPCGYRTLDKLQLPERTGDHEADYDAVAKTPVRRALAGELDEFHDCWRSSGITAGNRQAGFPLDDDRRFAFAQAQ